MFYTYVGLKEKYSSFLLEQMFILGFKYTSV